MNSILDQRRPTTTALSRVPSPRDRIRANRNKQA